MASRDVSRLPTDRAVRCRALEALKDMAMPAGNAEINAAVADAFGLSEEQCSLLHGDGPQTELAYRVGWARTGLRQAGALENAGKALWNLTSAGRKMSCAEVERAYNEYLRSRRTSDKGGRSAQFTSSKDDYSPVEDWRQSVCAALQAMPSHAFARLVGKLLESAGFDEVQVTGKVADGGIDAVGVYRPFGLMQSARTSNAGVGEDPSAEIALRHSSGPADTRAIAASS